MKTYVLTVLIVLVSSNMVFGQEITVAELQKQINEIKQELRLLQIDHSVLKTEYIKLLTAQLIAQQPQQQPMQVPQQPSPKQPQQVSVAGVPIDIGDNPVIGSESAKLILIEFTDYQCSFCSSYVESVNKV